MYSSRATYMFHRGKSVQSLLNTNTIFIYMFISSEQAGLPDGFQEPSRKAPTLNHPLRITKYISLRPP